MEFMRNVDFLDLPTINNSKLQGLCHPQTETLVKEADAWLRSRAQQTGYEDKEGTLEKLIASKIALLACRCYPHSPDAKVTLTLIKVMYWFFVFDELMDEPTTLGADPVASQQFCGFLLQAFFSVQPSRVGATVSLMPSSVALSPLLATLTIILLVEWRAELRVGMSALQEARFCSQFADYVLVHAQQAQLRQDKELPDLEEYLKMRVVAAGMHVVEMLVEKDCGIELDGHDLNNPSIKRLNKAIGRQVALLNDYMGFAHEFETGDYVNLLTVLHHRNNLVVSKSGKLVPFQKACIEARKILQALEEDCVTFAKDVEEWAHMHSNLGLLNYVSALCSISVSNWSFCNESVRYTSFNRCSLSSLSVDGATFERIQLTPLDA